MTLGSPLPSPSPTKCPGRATTRPSFRTPGRRKGPTACTLGWNYFYDLLHTYAPWIPLLVTAAVIVVNLLESRGPLRIATAAMLTGAVLDGGYIVATHSLALLR